MTNTIKLPKTEDDRLVLIDTGILHSPNDDTLMLVWYVCEVESTSEYSLIQYVKFYNPGTTLNDINADLKTLNFEDIEHTDLGYECDSEAEVWNIINDETFGKNGPEVVEFKHTDAIPFVLIKE